MTTTINHRTTYSKSPVLLLNENNYRLAVALTKEGEIYRLLDWKEEPEPCDSMEIALGYKTVQLIDNWKKYRAYSSGYDLQKLDIIQKYKLQHEYYRISDCPLHSLDINIYYAATKCIDLSKDKDKMHKELVKYRTEITSLKDQLRTVQAKLKVPAKMAEKNCTDKQALAYVLGGKLYDTYLDKLFANKIIHPNGYTGIGRYTSKGSDKAAAIANILSLCHIKHTTGNDAPKGGFSGNFVKIK